MTWKHKNCATDISLWNSSSLPLSSNTDWNKECRLNMFSTDGRKIKKFLIKEFVNNSSHFAGCPAINANEFWTLAVTFIYFSKSHFHSHARSPYTFASLVEVLNASRLMLPKNLKNILCMPAVVLLWSPNLHMVHYSTREFFFLFHRMQVCNHSVRALILSHVN